MSMMPSCFRRLSLRVIEAAIVGWVLLAPSTAQSQVNTYSRTETIEYHDAASLWVMGQVGKVTCTTSVPADAACNGGAGSVMSQTDYGWKALPWKTYAFGKLTNTLTYETTATGQAGTVKTVTDGNGSVTTLSSWERGIPQLIRYPATPEVPSGASQAAVVNPSGWITRITDENGFQTNYTYDAMGRLASIAYPAGDSTAWNTTTQVFEWVTASEYGIPAGHWRQTVSTGSGRKVTYFDALWRPLVTREYDTANVAGTQRFQRFAYDHEGRRTFASYPGTTDALTTGTRTVYDSLGRVTSVTQDSELGPLTTGTVYLSGFSTRVTNPRNQQTITSYRAYDQPTYDWPTTISHPEAAFTHITRDVHGKPTVLRRSNSSSATGGTGVSRTYTYNGYQELCRAVEPETGATLMGYDNAGNPTWSASGLPGATACDTTGSSAAVVARKVVRTFDARNRIKTLSFPDGKGNQSWSYTPDGLPANVTTNNANGGDAVSNSYTYNRRRLPTSEVMGVGSQQWSIGYTYNVNGHLASHLYPEGTTVSYAPNALGQPTQAGSYATGVSYYPNGAIKQFTYGNSIVHTLTQNTRQLPERSRDAYGSTAVHDDSLDFDFNGNVAAITDGLDGARGNRDMTYDGLDRLTGVASPMFGTASYTYDALDNLKAVRVTAGSKTRDHTYVYNASQHLTNITVAGGASVVGLSYDVQGNLANKNGVVHNFDYGNRLREVSGVEQYRYDGHGRRVQAIRNGASIYSVYGQDGVLRFQRNERIGQRTAYVYLAGSLVAQVEDAVAPPTPVLMAPGYSSTGSYAVNWTSALAATKYQLQERANSGTWATIHDASGTSKAISGKAAGTYGYQVRACNAATCSGWSAEATTTVQLAPGSAPTLSVPATGANGSYSVTWTAIAAADGYQLQERLGTGTWSTIHDAAGTSKAFTGKAAGSWSYQVRACNAAGCGAYSAIATVQVVYAPASAPTLTVPATSYTGSYSISWIAVSAATAYELEERLGTGSWTQVHNAGATSKAVSGKSAGSWGYRVRACNAAGCGAYSAIGTVAVTLPPAGAPTLTVPATSYTGSYTVSWTAVATATTYQLEEQTNAGSWTQLQNTSAVSRAISGKAAATYGYRVRACNVAGCGGYSAVGSLQVTLPPANAPALTVPASNSTGSYSVSWTAVSAATAYQLEEQVNGGSWAQIQNTSATSRSITGKGAGSYAYRVRACNVAGCGAYSAVATVQVALPLATPTISGPSSSTSDFAFTLTWTSVAGASSYELQQSANNNAWNTLQNTSATSITVQRRGGTFRYQVRACSASSCGPFSAIHTVDVIQTNNIVAPTGEDTL